MKYFKNTSWLFGEKILRMVVGLFVGIWVARYLGPEQFGLFSYAQSFVGLFTVIATLGLDSIVVRELVKDVSRRDEIIGTAFWLKLLGAFGVLIVLAIAVNFTSNDAYTNTLVFIIASATIFQSFNVIDFYFQSKVISKYIVFANIISLFISSVLKVVLILYEAPLIYFAWVVIFDSVVLASGFIYFYLYVDHSKLKIKNLIFKRETAISLLRDSWPLMMAGMSFVIFTNIDNVMIKEILDEYHVGIYQAAYTLVTLWYFIPGLILSSLLPSLVKSHSNSKLFTKRILMVSTLLLWVSIIICLVYYVSSEKIIALTYGIQYKQSAEIMKLLCIVNILIFYNSLWNYWMMIENNTKRTLFFHLSTAIFNLIFNYFLINIYGVVGAVYALLFSLIISFIIFGLYDRRLFKLFISSILLEVFWSSKKGSFNDLTK